MFFNQAFGMAPGMGGAGAGGLTSPGMNPQTLAALMAMSGNRSPGMAPAAGPPVMPTPGAPSNNATSAPIPPANVPQPQNILQMLMANPNLLKQLLGGLGGAFGMGGTTTTGPAASLGAGAGLNGNVTANVS